MQFGNSDLYFICRLMLPEGTGAKAQDITKCNTEIADACWMPLDEFKDQTRHSMLAVVADMLEKPEENELKRWGFVGRDLDGWMDGFFLCGPGAVLGRADFRSGRFGFVPTFTR